jgi:hypothetical protein
VYAPISAGLTFNVIRESGPGQERFNHEIAKGEVPVAHAGGNKLINATGPCAVRRKSLRGRPLPLRKEILKISFIDSTRLRLGVAILYQTPSDFENNETLAGTEDCNSLAFKRPQVRTFV